MQDQVRHLKGILEEKTNANKVLKNELHSVGVEVQQAAQAMSFETTETANIAQRHEQMQLHFDGLKREAYAVIEEKQVYIYKISFLVGKYEASIECDILSINRMQW